MAIVSLLLILLTALVTGIVVAIDPAFDLPNRFLFLPRPM